MIIKKHDITRQIYLINIPNHVFIISLLTACIIFFTSIDAYCNPSSTRLGRIDSYKYAEDILDLLNNNQYSKAENYLEELLNKGFITEDGIRSLEVVYEKLTSANAGQRLTAWCEASPDSHFPFTIRGGYYLDLVRDARGSDSFHTVTAERKKQMDRYLDEAQKDLEHAYNLNNKDAHAAALMITVALLTSESPSSMENWFQRAVIADSFWQNAYRSKLNYLAPYWHGSEEQQYDFAMDCKKQSPPGSSIYSVTLDYYLRKARLSTNKRFIQNQFMLEPRVLSVVESILEKYQQEFPQSLRADLYQARVSKYLGNFAEQLTILNSIIASEPGYTTALEERAELFKLKGELGRAKKDYTTIAAVEPNNASALFELGLLYHRMERDYPNAIKHINLAIAASNDPHYLRYYYYRLGELHRENRELDQAISLYDKSLEINNRFGPSYLAKAKVLHRQGKLEEAIAVLVTARKMARGADARQAGELAREYRQALAVSKQQHIQPDALPKDMIPPLPGPPTLPDAVEKPPASVVSIPAILALCEEHYLKGQADKAFQCYNKVLKQSPGNGQALYMLGLVDEVLRGSVGQAVDYYRRAMDSAPHQVTYSMAFAAALTKTNQHERALEVLTGILQLNPTLGKAHYLMGVSMDALGRKKDAARSMEMAVLYGQLPEAKQYLNEQNPQHLSPAPRMNEREELIRLAANDMVQRRYNQAEEKLEELLALNPNDDYAYQQLGMVYRERDHNDTKALEYFNKAIELNPNEKSYYYTRAALHRYASRYEKVIEDYSRMLEIDPKDGKTYRSRADIYFKTKKYKKAEKDYFNAKKYYPAKRDYCNQQLAKLSVFTKSDIVFDEHNVDQLLSRAQQLVIEKEFDRALSDYQQAVSIAPQSDKAHYQLARLWRDTFRDTDKAIFYLTKSIELNGGNTDYYFDRGFVYYKRKDYASAIADFSEVIARQPKKSRALYYRGMSRMYEGLQAEAAEDLTAVVQLNKNMVDAARGALQRMKTSQ